MSVGNNACVNALLLLLLFSLEIRLFFYVPCDSSSGVCRCNVVFCVIILELGSKNHP